MYEKNKILEDSTKLSIKKIINWLIHKGIKG